MTLVSFSAALASYTTSVDKSNEIFDRNLVNYAYILKSLASHLDIQSENDTQYAYQIWQENSLLTKTPNAPLEPMSKSQKGFNDENFNSQRWRTFSLNVTDKNIRIVVAEPLSTRLELAEELAITSMAPLVFATIILALLIAITINRSLLPLKILSRKLMRKEADDFTAIDLPNCPAELKPVIKTVNRLSKRVELAFEREKRFASDAAHELRTPISLLRVNLYNLLELHPELADEINQLKMGTKRMSHVVEQILLLNRTHPDHFKANFTQLNVTQLCQRSVAENYDLISEKSQNIELKHLPSTIEGDEFAIMSMLNNLISNASKYTPENGDILVSIITTGEQLSLIVEDSGPGIDEKEYDRVLDRFYRVHGDQHPSGIIGCGLGMAIVAQVVNLHFAKIRLDRSQKLGGLLVAVEFPLHGDQL